MEREVSIGTGRILTLFILLIILSSCSIVRPASSVKSYLDVKKEYVAALETASEWGPPSNYRLAIIPPMVEPYKPGTPLSKGSYEPLTDECLVRETIVSEELADPPVSAYEMAFDVSLGLPPILKQAIQNVADFKISRDAKETAVFALSLSKSVTARSDVLRRAMLNEGCFSSVVGIDIVMVRGLIYGSESIATQKTLRAGAVSAVLGEKNIEVRYDSTGGYEVRDTVNKPKFWIVSDLRIDIPGLTADTSPSDRRKLIRDHLNLKLEGASFREQAPTKDTLNELEDKVAPAAPTNLRYMGVSP